jgi:peptidoglycan/xylan/chitin deacetylase (PgdA/CDA1 family)
MSHTVGVTAPLNMEPHADRQNQPARRLYLLYHELRSSRSRYSYVIDTALFEKHLDLYVDLAAHNSPLLPEITFDDGHISNFILAAPILQSRGLTATFFITAGWTGSRPGYMGWAELQSLHQAGHTIGAHGLTHKLLTHCNQRELQAELRDARLLLEDKLATAITTLSLPGGRYTRRILRACEESGYTRVYTSIPKAESLPLGTTVGRLNILGDMQPEWIAQLFVPDSRLLKNIQQQYRRKEAVKKLLGDRLYAKLWAIVNRQETESGEDPAE